MSGYAFMRWRLANVKDRSSRPTLSNAPEDFGRLQRMGMFLASLWRAAVGRTLCVPTELRRDVRVTGVIAP